jgi:hypothetical protein
MKLENPENFNVELGQKVLRHLRTHPWQHTQDNWANCIAGWVVRMHDEDMRYLPPGSRTVERRACIRAGGYLGLAEQTLHIDGVSERNWLFSYCLPVIARAKLASCIRQAKRAQRKAAKACRQDDYGLAA